MKRNTLNLRDLGGFPLTDVKGQTPRGLYLRSGKLRSFIVQRYNNFSTTRLQRNNNYDFTPIIVAYEGFLRWISV